MKRDKEEVIKPDLSPEKAIELFKKQIAKIDGLLEISRKDPEVDAFRNFNINLIIRTFGKPSVNLSAYYSSETGGPIFGSMPDYKWQENYKNGLLNIRKLFESFIEQLQIFEDKETVKKEDNPILEIKTLCERFPLIVREFRKRYNNRATIDVKDEYDIQDIFRVILKIFFDDIRTEEWTPSYAGGSSRMDFLLKNESIVLEIKKTRDNLRAREIGDQLIVDITRYQVHPNCKTLFCFVYDPEGFISNPAGLERDLYRKENNLEIFIIIVPKGY